MRTVARSLGRLSKEWLEQNNPYRLKAIHTLQRKSGYSRKMAESMLDGLFHEITEPKIKKLIRREHKTPKTILHIFSSTSPEAAIQSTVLGMLAGSQNILKLSRQSEGFLPIYLDSLKKEDPKLFSTNRLLKAQNFDTLKKNYIKADAVIAYGSDETLKQIKKDIPSKIKFVGCGHRFSFSVLAKEALTKSNLASMIKNLGQDVWLMDQSGCLSSLVLFVEKGGNISPADIAAHLAGHFKKNDFNKGLKITASRAAAHEKLKHLFEFQKIKNKRVLLWQSKPKGAWSIFYTEKVRPDLLAYAGQQRVLVVAFSNVREIAGFLKPYSKNIQAMALEAPFSKKTKWARQFKNLKLSRICPAGRLQYPPLHWKHDGNEQLFPFLF